MRAAVPQQRCERGVRQRRVGGRLGEAAEGAELKKQRASSGSGSQVALTSHDAGPQVQAAVGNACGGHKRPGERLAQLRRLTQEKPIVSARKRDVAPNNRIRAMIIVCADPASSNAALQNELDRKARRQ